MTPAEARGLFTAARVARLATADADGRPHLVPVVFAAGVLATGSAGRRPAEGEEQAGGDALVMAVDHKPKRTTSLKRLANMAVRPEVSLLVDHYEEDWELLWWTRADGLARILPPPHEDGPLAARAADHVNLLRTKYAPQYAGRAPAGPVVEITVGRWSGWRAR